MSRLRAILEDEGMAVPEDAGAKLRQMSTKLYLAHSRDSEPYTSRRCDECIDLSNIKEAIMMRAVQHIGKDLTFPNDDDVQALLGSLYEIRNEHTVQADPDLLGAYFARSGQHDQRTDLLVRALGCRDGAQLGEFCTKTLELENRKRDREDGLAFLAPVFGVPPGFFDVLTTIGELRHARGVAPSLT